MKKAIQFLLLVILIFILTGSIIFFFNPFNLRNKMLGSMINYYFQVEKLQTNGTANNVIKNLNTADNTNPLSGDIVIQDKNPLLSEEQEQKLESYGVDVEALPKEITPGMSACFVEKLGETRATEIATGASPSALEIFKAKECLSK